MRAQQVTQLKQQPEMASPATAPDWHGLQASSCAPDTLCGAFADLVHAVDDAVLCNEEVHQRRAVGYRTVFLAGLIDLLVGLAGTNQALVHLPSSLLGDCQHINQLCIIEQVALHSQAA